jgi:transcriptional regulator with XRE-family HTH domain
MLQIGKTLAIAIRQKRTQLNYSQEYMALRLGQTQNAYCKVELGQTKLTLMRLLKICEVFEIDISDFLSTIVEPKLKAA